jgi:hypothetical protein
VLALAQAFSTFTELAETLGLWVAAGVGVAAIIVSNHDPDIQTRVMQNQLAAMQGQLNALKEFAREEFQ